jgi:hypothetical protein
MEKKSDTYQIATDIQWEYAGDGMIKQLCKIIFCKAALYKSQPLY